MRNRLGLSAVVAAMAATYGCGGGATTSTTTTGTGGSTASSTSSSTTASSTTGSTGGAAASSSSSTGSTGGSTSASSGTGGMMAPVCTPSDGVTLAIDTLNFGENNTWQGLGFNIDGLTTTATSTNVCQPVSGGTKATAYPDGNNGIDNSFGKNIVPTLSLMGSISQSSNSNIAMGGFSILFDFAGLTTMADQSPVVTRLYSGTALGMAPKFDGTDCWPVAPELLSNPTDITSSTIVFSQSAVTANLWTSGAPATVKLTIPFSGSAVITLTLQKAQVSLLFAADHQSATKGLIGGVLDTDEFIKEVKKAAAAINECALIGLVEPSLRQASDIMNDGTQDPTKTCNGISIGLGFTMKAVQLGGIGPATPPNNTTCP